MRGIVAAPRRDGDSARLRHASPNGHRARPQGKAVGRLRPRLAGLEPRRQNPELALETLESYRERYRPVAKLAEMPDEFDQPVRSRSWRTGSAPAQLTSGAISFSPSSTEQGPLSEAELERGITLLRACWAFFDEVAARVSPEMRKGPRGGGRDRDRIIRHTIRTESEDFAKQVGLRIPEEAALTPDGAAPASADYVAAMRAYNAGEVPQRMRSWTLPFLIRHSAFHTLDHAWEMEDKDLSAEAVGSR